MADPVSIHRKEDLAHARALAEHCRLKLGAPGAPPNAITDQIIERLADILQDERIWRQNEIARFRAELETGIAEVRGEMIAKMARVRTLMDAAAEAFMHVHKALELVHETLKEHAAEPK